MTFIDPALDQDNAYEYSVLFLRDFQKYFLQFMKISK